MIFSTKWKKTNLNPFKMVPMFILIFRWIIFTLYESHITTKWNLYDKNRKIIEYFECLKNFLWNKRNHIKRAFTISVFPFLNSKMKYIDDVAVFVWKFLETNRFWLVFNVPDSQVYGHIFWRKKNRPISTKLTSLIESFQRPRILSQFYWYFKAIQTYSWAQSTQSTSYFTRKFFSGIWFSCCYFFFLLYLFNPIKISKA